MMAQKKAVRKERIDKGKIQLTDRDLWALRWIADQYVVRLDQVQNLLGQQAGRGAKEEGMISENAARLVVNRWMRAGLVAYKKITVEEPGWVWMTAQGVHAFELGYKVYEPSLAKLAHLFAINEVRRLLEYTRPEGTWVSERMLRKGQTYRKDEFHDHIPDAFYILRGRRIAIEVELTPKKPRELQLILQELAETYLEVWYYAGCEAYNAVVAARNHLEQSLADRIVVHKYDDEDEDEDEASEKG